MQAVSHSLWVALYAAQQAELDDVVEILGRLHLQTVRQAGQHVEAA